MRTNPLIAQYNRIKGHLPLVESEIIADIKRVCPQEELKIHSFNARTKSPASLKGKLVQPDKTYGSLFDITDLIGIRIITYFDDSIEKIAKIIEQNFDCDFQNSINKKSLDPNRFGYTSLHYVCRLPANLREALELPAELCFEIQIRTILQHAWAEIEHDLGYKTQEAIPKNMRRRLSRLAGLLEIADDEFVAIKEELTQYEAKLNEEMSTPEKSGSSLNKLSLVSYIRNPKITEIDLEIANSLDIPLDNNPFFPEYLLRLLNHVGLHSIRELDQFIATDSIKIAEFAKPYFAFTKKTWGFDHTDLDRFQRGYSLFFLGHLIAYEKEKLELKKIDSLTEFYNTLDYPSDTTMARKVATNFVEAVNNYQKYEKHHQSEQQSHSESL